MADRAFAEERRAALDGLHRYRRVGGHRAALAQTIEKRGSVGSELLVHRPEHIEHRLLAHVRAADFLDCRDRGTQRLREFGATILYVTHDQTEAMTMATHIGVLDQGRLVQIGSPRQIYADPVNTYVAMRLGSPAINLVPRRLYPNVEAPAAAETIGVRTEHVRIRKSANGGAVGRVKWIEHLGDQNHLHVTIADTDVVTLCDRDAGVVVGDAVDVELTAPLFFAANGERVRAN